jgi:hypothetical protein
MSRGLGKLQIKILKSIQSIKMAKWWVGIRSGGKVKKWPCLPLIGRTKAKTTAMNRAGMALARMGKVVVIRYWHNRYRDGKRRVCAHAFPSKISRYPEHLAVLRVDLVSHPVGTAYKGSIRDRAISANTAVTTFWRQIRKAKVDPNKKS